jgi:serine protease inhibitor
MRLVAVDGDGDTTELGVASDPDAALATVRRWIEESTAS